MINLAPSDLIEIFTSISPILKIFGFILIHIFMAISFIPCSPLTIIAGVLWGGFYGTIASIFASTLSCAATFYLSRTFLRRKIRRYISNSFPKIALLIKRTDNNPKKIIGLMQINPLIPGSSLGYLFGMTKIKLKNYLFLTFFFSLPLNIIYVLTGNSIYTFYIYKSWHSLFFALILILLLFSKKIKVKLTYLIGKV